MQTEPKKGLNSGFDQGKQFAISQYLIPEVEIDYWDVTIAISFCALHFREFDCDQDYIDYNFRWA